MYTIINNNKYVLEIKKSTFIALLYKVKSISEVEKYLGEVKNEYKDASHYVFAYIIDDKRKFSDDGEPGGTAGLPIMEVLNKHDLNYVLCIVVRYFGGIKLGAGGLVRAYTKAVSNCILKENIIKLVDGYLLNIEINYDKQKELDIVLKGYSYKKEYGSIIKYLIKGDNELLDKLKNININYLIKEKILIEKGTDF